jgi:hypothetical protein
MPRLSPFDRRRFRAGHWLGGIAIVCGLAAAVMALADGAPMRALVPLATVGFMLWWLRQLPRRDAS